jgi:tRNA A-37 threonylcarbamoyl transferase component Bud32
VTDGEMHTQAQVVASRYRLVRELGRGGMGTVWLASDQLAGRQVAVKELRPPHGLSQAEQDVFTQRALQEARSAARIHHPGAVTLYDILPATSDDDAVYLIMEYLDGPTLAELMQASGAQPAPRVAAWGLQLLSVLETAHGLGIVHRDIKPANIILTAGQARLTDFGIAHTVGDPRLTRVGIMGTRAYLAPELLNSAPLSPAADLWSLGATLYAAAAGRGPFDRDNPAATLHAVLVGDLPAAPGPPALAAAITGLLQRDPARRATIAQAREQLQRAAQLPGSPQLPAGQVTSGVAFPVHGGPADAPPTLWERAPTTRSPSAAGAPPRAEQPQFAWTAEWRGLARVLMWSEARQALAEGRRPSILVFGWGIRASDGQGEVSARWEEITQLWREATQQPIATVTYQMRYRYRLQFASGRFQVFAGMLGEGTDRWSRVTPLVARPGVTTRVTIEQLGRLLDDGVTRVQLPLALDRFRAGQPVVFGPLAVGQNGVASGPQLLPWTEIHGVQARNDAVFFMRAGIWWPWARLLASQIPNYPVFEALVRTVLAQRPPVPRH